MPLTSPAAMIGANNFVELVVVVALFCLETTGAEHQNDASLLLMKGLSKVTEALGAFEAEHTEYGS